MLSSADIPTRQQRAAKLRESERLADGDSRRDFWFTMLECWLWVLLGLACVGWAFHTTDEKAGRIAFQLGVIINNGGVLQALARWYLRRGKRGDW